MKKPKNESKVVKTGTKEHRVKTLEGMIKHHQELVDKHSLAICNLKAKLKEGK